MDELTKKLATLSPAKRALLERRLGGRNGAATRQPVLAARTGAEPARASFAQERLWFLHQLDPQSVAYNLPRAIRIRGKLDLNVLRESLNEIVARHAVLRTHFAIVDGSLRQIVDEEIKIELPVVDLQKDECAELIKHEASVPFDLSTGPVMRALPRTAARW